MKNKVILHLDLKKITQLTYTFTSIHTMIGLSMKIVGINSEHVNNPEV